MKPSVLVAPVIINKVKNQVKFLKIKLKKPPQSKVIGWLFQEYLCFELQILNYPL